MLVLVGKGDMRLFYPTHLAFAICLYSLHNQREIDAT